MRAYSTDLREKIVLAYEGGEGTFDEIADTFGVARCTVGRLLKLARSGSGLAPLPHGGGYPASLAVRRLTLLRAQVERQPDATLEELAAYLKKKARVQVHPSTVCRALRRLDLPRKKSLAASERVGADRQAFRRRVARLDRRRLVFTDETGFHLAMTRAYGRAARGERINQSVPRNHGRGVTLIGSLGLRGLLAPLSLEGALDAVAFDSYISRMLVRQLRPQDVVLLDNLPVHQASQVEQAVTAAETFDVLQVAWSRAFPMGSSTRAWLPKVTMPTRSSGPRWVMASRTQFLAPSRMSAGMLSD